MNTETALKASVVRSCLDFMFALKAMNDLICPQKVHFKIWQCSNTQRLFASEIKEIK